MSVDDGALSSGEYVLVQSTFRLPYLCVWSSGDEDLSTALHHAGTAETTGKQGGVKERESIDVKGSGVSSPTSHVSAWR